MTSFVFVLKLILTPTLIGSASLAGRKWGPAISGWLIGLPLTTGPVIFFLSLQHGEAYAASAALGTLSGGIALSAFTFGYAWLAQYVKWPVAVIASSILHLSLTFLLQQVTFAPVPLFFGLIVLLILALRSLPRIREDDQQVQIPLPRWDLPARMIVATTVVLSLTGFSTLLGPRLTGLLSTFPVYTTILAAFAQHLQGPRAVLRVLQGVLAGLFSFAFFFVTLSLTLAPFGTSGAFLCAILAALTAQVGSLLVLRRIK
jgi:hypothetical protein